MSACRLQFALVAGLLLAAAPPPARAGGFDADSARVKARALVPFVVHADAAPLWREFDATMRAALKDSAAFATTLASMQAQTGALDSLLSDSVSTPQPGMFLYRARCRFVKFPQPLELSIAFDGDGRVSGMLLRPPPDQPHSEYPSLHLDYRNRTTLKLPVRGEWSVVWGGRTIKQNYHAYTRDQRFALDLLIVRGGRTHDGDGKKLSDYYCYGEPVLAPAAGIVVWVQDGLPDNPPGQMDPAHATGNSLILAHGNGEYSLIAHLQPGSLRFKKGDHVNADAEIGRCGNSGNTSEPHVHYHLQNGPKPFDADGLPVTFVDLVVDGKPVGAAELVQGQRVRRAN